MLDGSQKQGEKAVKMLGKLSNLDFFYEILFEH